MPDYGTLARAVSGFTDILEQEVNHATGKKREAEALLRSLCPDMSEAERTLRVRAYDARAEELTHVMLRLRRLLSQVASSGENPLPAEEGAEE